MKRFYSQATAVLLASLLFTACNDDKKNYPTDYVGFEHSSTTYSYDTKSTEETVTVKVIAIEKKKENRVIKIGINRSPALGDAFKLVAEKVTIEAGKKEAEVTIKLYPKKVIRGSFIQLTSMPQWKDAQNSQLSLRLIPK